MSIGQRGQKERRQQRNESYILRGEGVFKDETEIYLNKVYWAEKDKRRLLRDLANYKNDLGQAYEPRKTHREVVVKKTQTKHSEVEKMAIRICDDLRAPLDDLEREIALCDAIIDDVKKTVEKAELTEREKEYVRLRYHRNYSVEKVEREMHCTNSKRIRETALKKIERMKKKSLA